MPDAVENPYGAPKESLGPSGFDGAVLGDLTAAEIKKLYNHSRSIGALTLIWLLGGGGLVLAGSVILAGGTTGQVKVSPDAGLSDLVGLLPLGIGGLMTAAAICCWRRLAWGRTVGIVLCCLGLLQFPLGTLISIMGLIAFARGKLLFGPGRLTHGALKESVAASKWRK